MLGMGCAAVLVLGGCTGGGSDAEPDAASPSADASGGAPGPTLGPERRPPDTAVPGPQPTVEGPNTAGLGPLTPAQEEYVSANAPPGVDAGAVLLAGQDTCTRLETAAASGGPDAVVVALVSGQVPSAEKAIRHLCPELTDALERAENGFPDGRFTIGAQAVPNQQVASGTYTAPQPGGTCSWAVHDSSGAVVAQGDTASPEMVLPDAGTVSSQGCGAWVPQ